MKTKSEDDMIRRLGPAWVAVAFTVAYVLGMLTVAVFLYPLFWVIYSWLK